MTREAQEVEPVAKYQRTITLTQDIADRLQAVCDHLGVTASAYIKQALGESVSRHEVSLLAKQSKDSSLEILERLFTAVAEQVDQEPDNGKKQPGAPKAK
jgi:hypothetical protein